MIDRLPYRSLLGLLAALALLAFPALASAAGKEGNKHAQPPLSTAAGSLEQLPGRLGCLSSGKAAKKVCGRARALKGAGPGVGSRAVAISPDGRNVYVAASGSNAIAVFDRNPVTGALTQPQGKGGCVAAVVKGKGDGCGLAIGLLAPNSVAVSPDGRNVYATSRDGSSLTTFIRNRRTGQLRQLPPGASGCISGLPIPTCTAGRAMKWPDVVVVSPDGKNVYVGDFAGSGVLSFARAGKAGALTQLSGTAGCITEAGAEGCAKGIAMDHVEGMAINPSGSTVYGAAAFGSAISILQREAATGALTQATDGNGCIAVEAVAGCAQGYQFAGVNALVVSPKGGNVYATSLTSNSVTMFRRTEGGGLAQPARPEGENIPAGLGNPEGCLVYLRSPGCSFGRAMSVPEGLALSPAGDNLYVTAFISGAMDVLDRNLRSGVVTQKPGERGCLAAPKVGGCGPGRALGLTGSVVVSPDGRNVYSTSQESSAVDVFRRIR
ncbi:MAG: beta-propeller fold lactonase family protein [Actinobacteria bacterium]|nr:beta-propeller fold lactonase family protein [Actinomycetota bacterium]